MKYEDRILLSLRRQYSEREAVALINQELTKTQIELGVVKSERDEAQYLLKVAKEKNKQLQEKMRGQRQHIKEVEAKLNKYKGELSECEVMKEMKLKFKEALQGKDEEIKRLRRVRDQ